MQKSFLRASLVAALAALHGAPPADAAATTRKGVFRATVMVTSDASVPLATPMQVRVSARANGTGGQQSAEGTVTVNKTSASQAVTVDVPYQWTLNGPSATVTLSTVVTPSLPSPLFNSASLSLAVPLPANNATTPITIWTRL